MLVSLRIALWEITNTLKPGGYNTPTYEIIFLLVTNFNMIMIIHEVYAVWGLHI